MAEREALALVNHPFIINLHYSFHNESYFLQIIYSFPRIPYSYLQC